MVEIIYIARFFKHSKFFIENLFDELKEKGVKDIKYIPQNMMVETGKFRIYGLPINSSCLGLSHSKVEYYVDGIFVSDREVTENEYGRYEHLLQTFPIKTKEIKYDELIEILVNRNEG